MAMDCKPEAQKRLTVVPGTEVGRPATIADTRAMLWPCTPCGCPQPRITSSTSAGSSCGVFRRTSRMQCAARSSGRVRLNDPRNDFASGVRELATITASRIRGVLFGVLRDSLALLGKALQKRCGLPQLAV